MRRIRCRPLTVEGCVTRYGTLVGPLSTELTGFSALTPFRGGWCGNELAGDALNWTSAARCPARATEAARAAGWAQAGYRGYFLGLTTCSTRTRATSSLASWHPRITGVTPLTSQAALDAEDVPLLLYHLMEWLGVDYRLDVSRYNDLWVDPTRAAGWGQLIIEHTEDTDEVMTDAPVSGIYRLSLEGTVGFARREYLSRAVRDEAEALFMRTVNTGHFIREGQCLRPAPHAAGSLSEDWRLSSRAKAWVRGFRDLFTSQPLTELVGVM